MSDDGGRETYLPFGQQPATACGELRAAHTTLPVVDEWGQMYSKVVHICQYIWRVLYIILYGIYMIE
jgi:hypothetical protein